MSLERRRPQSRDENEKIVVSLNSRCSAQGRGTSSPLPRPSPFGITHAEHSGTPRAAQEVSSGLLPSCADECFPLYRQTRATHRTRMISRALSAPCSNHVMPEPGPHAIRYRSTHQQDFQPDHPAHPRRSHIRPAPPSTTSCQAGTSLPSEHRMPPDASRYMSSVGRPRRSDRCTDRGRLGREHTAIRRAIATATAMDMATELQGQSAG
jgi:hypothetical protein